MINWGKLSRFYDDCGCRGGRSGLSGRRRRRRRLRHSLLVFPFGFLLLCVAYFSRAAYSISLGAVENALKPFVWVVSRLLWWHTSSRRHIKFIWGWKLENSFRRIFISIATIVAISQWTPVSNLTGSAHSNPIQKNPKRKEKKKTITILIKTREIHYENNKNAEWRITFHFWWGKLHRFFQRWLIPRDNCQPGSLFFFESVSITRPIVHENKLLMWTMQTRNPTIGPWRQPSHRHVSP